MRRSGFKLCPVRPLGEKLDFIQTVRPQFASKQGVVANLDQVTGALAGPHPLPNCAWLGGYPTIMVLVSFASESRFFTLFFTLSFFLLRVQAEDSELVQCGVSLRAKWVQRWVAGPQPVLLH